MALIRLDKYLADMKCGTRSQVKDTIRKNKVTVNGEIVKSPDRKIDIDTDQVTYEGEPVGYTEYEYYMLNKPAGTLSATSDKKQETVLDLLVDANRKDLFPVGRLDKDTEGLLLITNDGQLAHDLLAPKKHVDKVYESEVAGIIGDDVIEEFAKGIVVDEDFTALPARLEILSNNQEKNTSYIRITIHEGKFHQIKRMFEAVDSEVLYLKRMSMGTLQLDPELQCGDYRHLTEEELIDLKNINK